MLYRYPDYLHDFNCLAGACPDTCCRQQWEIVVDAETKKKYEALEGVLGETVRAAMYVDDEGDTCIGQVNGQCPLLTKDGLCALVCEHGPGLLSVTCDNHPRFSEIYGGLEETMLSLSCPAAADLLLEREKTLFFVTHTDEKPPQPNDLDGDIFQMVMAGRETALAILQDRQYRLSDRLALFLAFASRLDGCMDRPNVALALCENYKSCTYQKRELIRLRRHRRWGTMTHARQLLLAMEHLTEEFPTHLKELEATDVDQNAVQLEQLAVYYVFRWWLKAACDGYVWRQAAAVAVSVLAVSGLARTMGSVKEAARLYAKEVEHSEENLSILRKAMDLPHFSKKRLLMLLEVTNAI